MSHKRQNSDKHGDSPPEKVSFHTQSNIEYAMLNQKYKSLENEWKQRGIQLSKKQKELNETKQQMDSMRTNYEEQIGKLSNLLSFQTEEINANTFRGPQMPGFKEPNYIRKDTAQGECSKVSNQNPQVLSNISNNVPSKIPDKQEQVKNLMMNLLVRRLSNGTIKAEGDASGRYKIENDNNLPCNLSKNEMADRFQKMCTFRHKHPSESVNFGDYRVPRRQEVLNPKMIESNDRADRVSIWTALNANQERFLYRDPTHPVMQRMQLAGRNMEYTGMYAESRNSFEKLSAPNYTVPQWFSRFYV